MHELTLTFPLSNKLKRGMSIFIEELNQERF
jgi:hypothetical protein